MSREVMTQALEALEYIYEGANNQGPHTGISWRCVSNKAKPAITALRQAFANEALDKMAENARELGLDYEPAQRTWVGLTDEEKSDIWCVVTNRDFVTEDTHVYADAIEAKLKEKNNG